MGTGLLIGFLLLSGLAGLLRTSIGIPDASHALQMATQRAALIAFTFMLFESICSLAAAWLLFKLRLQAIKVLWLNATVSTMVLVVQLAFGELTFVRFATIGWWALFFTYALWTVIFVYAYRLKAQGRLSRNARPRVQPKQRLYW